MLVLDFSNTAPKGTVDVYISIDNSIPKADGTFSQKLIHADLISIIDMIRHSNREPNRVSLDVKNRIANSQLLAGRERGDCYSPYVFRGLFNLLFHPPGKWSNYETVLRYAHLSSDHLKMAAERVYDTF